MQGVLARGFRPREPFCVLLDHRLYRFNVEGFNCFDVFVHDNASTVLLYSIMSSNYHCFKGNMWQRNAASNPDPNRPAEFRQCFKCNYEAVAPPSVCPRCRNTKFLAAGAI